jgi:transposase
MHTEQGSMSRHNPAAKAIAYMVKDDRWKAFTPFLDDGRICLSNNAAERRCGGVALAGSHGSSPAPSAAAIVPPSCIP